MLPNGWIKTLFANLIASGDILGIQDGNHGNDHPKASDYIENGIPFIMARDLKQGKIDFTTCCYISKKQADALRIGFAKPMDILLSHKGTIGEVAIVPNLYEYVMLTPQVTYYRLKHDGKLNSDYLFQYFLSNNYQSKFKKLASQSTRNYLGITAQKELDVILPPLPEQKKIARILSTWDKAITTTEQLLANSQQQKKALMQQLLTGKKRLLDKNGVQFSGEWKFLSFNETFKVTNKKSTQVKSSDYLESGLIPIVDQGHKLIAGYCNNEEYYNDIPAIIFGDHTRCLKWVDFIFCLGADGTQVLDVKEKLDKKFSYYLLCNTDIPNLGYSRHMRELKQKEFKIPVELEEQEKIAAVLSAADQEITLLQGKLDALKQEKKALMQQLLTGKRRVKVQSETSEEKCYAN